MLHAYSAKALMGGAFVLAISGIAGAAYVISGAGGDYETALVVRQTIAEEVLASGNVEAPTRLDLHFRDTTRLASRSVEVGDEVAAGDVLAEQDTRALEAQRAELQAGVEVQKARLAQLLAGASSEDVGVSETAVKNAEQALSAARQSAIETLLDAYTKADDAVRAKIDPMFSNPRGTSPQLTFVSGDGAAALSAETQRVAVEAALMAWVQAFADIDHREDVAPDIEDGQARLRQVASFLDTLSRAFASQAGGISVETWKADVSAARAAVNTGLIALAGAAESLDSARGNLDSARGALALKQSAARPSDRALIEAQIRQAEAALERSSVDLRERTLAAPASGIVTAVEGEPGEIVGPSVAVVSMIPSGGLQVTVNVSEGNVIDVAEGQRVRVQLDAFGTERFWTGTVVRVDPAGTVIGGAVYYPTTILFENTEARIRPGMTANVWIETAVHPSALTVPMSAVHKRDGRSFVRVLQAGVPQEREVAAGLSGSDGAIEILSGLSEGEIVIVGERL